MTSRDEDDAWRAIVDNYGEWALLADPETDTEPGTRPDPGAGAEPAAGPPGESPGPYQEPAATPTPHDPDPGEGWRDEAQEERFVPPPPPPLPQVDPRRRLAWAALLGTPLLFVLAALAGITAAAWVHLPLLGAFVGGFGYLVATMPRGPRDPWDDGAQV